MCIRDSLKHHGYLTSQPSGRGEPQIVAQHRGLSAGPAAMEVGDQPVECAKPVSYTHLPWVGELLRHIGDGALRGAAR